MSVYEIEAQAKNGNFTFATLVFGRDLEDSDNDCSFKGVKQGASWKPPEFEWQCDEENSGKEREKSNFAHVFAGGLNLAVDSKAKKVLSAQFEQDIEFLPILIKDESEDWFLINVINVVDTALSLENSKFKMRGNGTFGRLTKAVFNLDNIPGDRPFVYPQWINAFMFNGEKFKNVVSDNNLIGLSFDEFESV
jgi:hypothetical protein